MQTQAGMENAFRRLAKSKFRSRFHLSADDRQYIAEKGMETIRRHCEDFVRTRLAQYPPLAGAATHREAATPSGQSEAKRLRESRATPPNDGRQTPMRGHPVFLAQHACACCCRGCMEKWWKVPKGTPIPPARQSRIVDFLMAWIEKEYSRGQESGVRG
jgi:exodeoxyribonuclease V alpha subunit